MIYTRKEGKTVYSQGQHPKVKCLECDKDYVPELIIATIEPPPGLNTIGSPKLIEERICRPKENMRMLQNKDRRAILVSESLFFMEYHLHS